MLVLFCNKGEMMNKRLYLYLQDFPRQKIFAAIMLIFCITLIFLLCPEEERLTGLIIAAAFTILVLVIRSLVLLYSRKKSPYRLLELDDKKLSLIDVNRVATELNWQDIKTIAINFDGGVVPEMRRFPEIQINITAAGQSVEFYSFVPLSAFELVKAAISKNVQIIYNTPDTQKYFEKMVNKLAISETKNPLYK